jgi:hypothetical protein
LQTTDQRALFGTSRGNEVIVDDEVLVDDDDDDDELSSLLLPKVAKSLFM